MAVLPIRVYPDPVLRVRCREVESFDDDLAKLVDDMVETMRAAPGIGLAANQVGVEKRVAVIDTSAGERAADLLVLVNPQILEEEDSEEDVEGCLSVPDITEKVIRPLTLRLEAQDISGRSLELEAEGLLARTICHEIDHLNGILFTDRLRGLRREKARRLLRRQAREQSIAT